jgi:hypothetical protein
MNSNAPTLEAPAEQRWKTYSSALIFLLPAMLLWEVVRAKCVPILISIVQNLGTNKGSAEPFWKFSMFLVDYGWSICLAVVVMCCLLELTSQGWARYRRNGVGGLVWVLNCAVISGLAALFTLTLIVFPARPQ